MREAGASRAALTGIAATAGPGLIGPLLVGFTYGKTLAWRRGLPFIGVHHLEGHLFAPTLEHPDLAPPFVALLVSGGHTMLLHVPEWGRYELMGQTRDDAAGEAFDKVAALLKLGYPGRTGHRATRARRGDPDRFRFPRPLLRGPASQRFEFSFSGLKTAVLRAVQQSDDLERDTNDLARGFQDAALEVLATKTALAAEECGVDRVVLGGGVACNAALAAVGRSVSRSVGHGRHSDAPPQHRQRRHDRSRRRVATRARASAAGGTRKHVTTCPFRAFQSPDRRDHEIDQMTTVYPLKFQLGPLEITGFGLMMMAAFLAGGWLIARQLREQKLNEDYAGDIVFGAVIVSIIGAKLWYVGLHGMDSLFSRGGLVWYGGFLGGCLGVTLASLRRGVPVRFTAQLVAPVLPAAYAIGRVGCFMVGDDYGVATTVPWGVKFPQGIPPTTAAGLAQFGFPVPAGASPADLLAVHPTQLYEVAIMTAVFMLLWHWRRKAGWGTGALFGLYLVFAGLERFAVEFLRAKDDRFFGGLTLAQVTSLAIVAIGVFWFPRMRNLGTVERRGLPQRKERMASRRRVEEMSAIRSLTSLTLFDSLRLSSTAARGAPAGPAPARAPRSLPPGPRRSDPVTAPAPCHRAGARGARRRRRSRAGAIRKIQRMATMASSTRVAWASRDSTVG